MMIHTSAQISTQSSCSIRLDTLVRKIDDVLPNSKNASIILAFYKYMQVKGSSENHELNNLKVAIDFAKFIGPMSFYDIKKKQQIISFLLKPTFNTLKLANSKSYRGFQN